MRAGNRPRGGGQRGAAVLMALFVATLATIIVSGLFWNQFVLLRTVENEQIGAQSRLLLRGALDWTRAILREDSVRSVVDTLAEPWAQGLADTRLDQLGETSTLAAQAALAGSIEDAQARLNLRNLVATDGAVDARERDALRRLATLLDLPEAIADLVAERMTLAFAGPGAEPGRAARPIPLVHPLDLAGVAGIDRAAAEALAPYVAVLDETTPVNFNTAPPEVLAARVEGLSLAEARALAANRDRIWFKDRADIQARLGQHAAALGPGDASTYSRYFVVRGRVTLERAVTRMEALVKRSAPGPNPGPPIVLWLRES